MACLCASVWHAPRPTLVKKPDPSVKNHVRTGPWAAQVPKVLVYHNEECGKRGDVHMEPGRDVFWQETIPHQSPAVRLAV